MLVGAFVMMGVLAWMPVHALLGRVGFGRYLVALVDSVDLIDVVELCVDGFVNMFLLFQTGRLGVIVSY